MMPLLIGVSPLQLKLSGEDKTSSRVRNCVTLLLSYTVFASVNVRCVKSASPTGDPGETLSGSPQL
jgi:hypothetical protein